MDAFYLISACVGGAILLIQAALLAIGMDHGDTDMEVGDAVDVDTHLDGDSVSSFFKVLSFKTVVAFMTFFGLTGLACGQAGLGTPASLVLAMAAGSLALYLVAFLMSAMARLQSKGNLNLANAVGKNGRIYLRVPPKLSGAGKVTLVVQGRSIQAKAVTSGDELATGTQVKVVRVSSSDTLEVLPMEA